MLKIKQAIVVEGVYDKNKLSQIVDTIIITTNGFSIFKDKQKKDYIKKIALERGLIILTDSDGAGLVIRNHLKSFISESLIENIYTPQIKGKEKRKENASKEGFLGVEGISVDLIIDLLKPYCKQEESVSKLETGTAYTIKDLYNLGLTGTDNSKEKKQLLLKKLDLPWFLSNKDLLKYLNQNKDKCKSVLENLEQSN